MKFIGSFEQKAKTSSSIATYLFPEVLLLVVHFVFAKITNISGSFGSSLALIYVYVLC
jgi:hypothetical protein